MRAACRRCTSTVGWNWTNSMSRTSAPARKAKACPSAVAISGFVVSRYSRPAPPVARIVCLAQTNVLPWLGFQTRPAARSFVRQQVDGEGRFPNEDVGPRADEVGHRPHHFLPGRIAQGMHDPPMAVPPFEREGDLAVVRVEMGSVSDQFADALGRLVDNHVDNRLVAEPLPRRHRIGRVTAEVIQRDRKRRRFPPAHRRCSTAASGPS